jgi:hypothetical protein
MLTVGDEVLASFTNMGGYIQPQVSSRRRRRGGGGEHTTHHTPHATHFFLSQFLSPEENRCLTKTGSGRT